MSGKTLVLEVTVPTEDRGYPVIVGAGLLSRLGDQVKRRVADAERVLLLSDDTVMTLHGEAATAALEGAGLRVVSHVVPAGETSKSMERLQALLSAMLAGGLGRHDVLVTLGGGVVGDLGGLGAALFMRGIEFVQCPTSLLAQVDASVGGKVAIDVPEGKNLVGAFHFPRLVLIDPDVLRTLPDRELGCGLAEMLKHGLLFSGDHVNDLVSQAASVYERSGPTLARLVATSVSLKAACVSRDPLERSAAGKGRVLLNLGHTVGHALESVSDFQLLHGEAVALGLRATARVSVARGLAPVSLEATVTDALEGLRLPTDLDTWLLRHGAGIGRAMINDKKRRGGTLTYIALEEIGRPVTFRATSDEILGLLRRE